MSWNRENNYEKNISRSYLMGWKGLQHRPSTAVTEYCRGFCNFVSLSWYNVDFIMLLHAPPLWCPLEEEKDAFNMVIK